MNCIAWYFSSSHSRKKSRVAANATQSRWSSQHKWHRELLSGIWGFVSYDSSVMPLLSYSLDFPFFYHLLLTFLFVLTYLLFFIYLDTFFYTHFPNSIKFRSSQAPLLLPFLTLTRYSPDRYFFVSSQEIIWIQWSWRQLVCSVYINCIEWTPKKKENSWVEILYSLIDIIHWSVTILVVHFHLFIPFTFDMGGMGMIWSYLIVNLN